MINRLKEKITDKLEMYTLSEIVHRLGYVWLITLALTIWYHLYHYDYEAERTVNPDNVSYWKKQQLTQEDPIPDTSGNVITHILISPSKCVAEVVIKQNIANNSSYYQRRLMNCSKGLYYQINDENSFEAVVGRTNGERAQAMYVNGVGGDAVSQFKYICEKYTKCIPNLTPNKQ